MDYLLLFFYREKRNPKNLVGPELQKRLSNTHSIEILKRYAR